MRDGEKPMILRLFSVGRLAALLLFGLGVAPAAAGGCVYGSGCFAPGPVIQPYYYQSCGCCGCGSSYYASFYPAYAYPAIAVGAGCCGYAYGYGAGYGVAPAPVFRPRVAYPRYVGPRRYPRPVSVRY
jgi:predicted MFS family arabinose efflux permease